jgi:hypothetical protein
MLNSFKLGNLLAILDGHNLKWIGKDVQFSSSTQRMAGKQTEAFFRKQEYLNKHSKEIAKIIYENWTKESGLFASCRYENGQKYLHHPSEPEVTNSGLVRQHLMFGYHHAGEFYREGKDESVKKCEEIEEIIETYNGAVIGEIERNIETSTGNHKLERKTRRDVFITKDTYEYYPDTFYFKRLYLYPDILSAIFNEAHSRNSEVEKQKIWIKQNDGYEYLVIGNVDPMQYKEEQLGFGDHEMMIELKSRVEKLVDDQRIRDLVRNYYVKQSELDTNTNISKYEEERKRIWRIVDKEAKPINGHCDKCSKEYLDSHF